MFTCLWLVCMLPPTYHSPQNVFYDDLRCTIKSVCEDDLLAVFGDFNARVGMVT